MRPKFTLLSLLALSLLLPGCSKNESKSAAAATNQPPTTASGNPITAPVDYLGAVAKAKRTAGSVVNLASVNQSIQMFYAQEDRYPKDLNELVTARYLPAIPTAPPGKRLVYNPANGQLRTVNAQ
jgi:hypothetical protein